MDITSPLVINLALTGMVPYRKDNPHVPITSDEIAADAERCFQAGARIFHIHARGKDEQPIYHREIFAETIQKIKQKVPDAIICVTTSGRLHKSFEERSDVLNLDGNLKPDLASLTLGSLNFPKQASVNDPEMITKLALRMAERGIVPELEIFDFGMLDYAHYLISRGILKPPFVFNLLLGSLGTLSATPLNLALLIDRLPAGSFWSAAGIGRFQFSMNALGVAMGGNVRTGLEDNLYMDSEKQDLASNENLVKRITTYALALGRRIATTNETRQILGLTSTTSE
jgi:3-keto-5-aminohexanoate cleavage enzyme